MEGHLVLKNITLKLWQVPHMSFMIHKKVLVHSQVISIKLFLIWYYHSMAFEENDFNSG